MAGTDRNVAVLVRQEGLGDVGGDRKFGLEMFDRFLHSLEGQEARPRTICFYTLGVKLVCRGSMAIPGLSLLEGLGVRLMACKTCLDEYGLIDEVAVGEVRGMNEIVKVLMEADHVITA